MGMGRRCQTPKSPPPQQRGDSGPAPARPAPPLEGFPDSRLLPPWAAGDPRCMCNGGWEQRRAGPDGRVPAAPTFSPELQCPAPHVSQDWPGDVPARPPRLGVPGHHWDREIGAWAAGEKSFTGELRLFTPAPTYPQTHMRWPNTSNHTPTAAGELSAGHPPRHVPPGGPSERGPVGFPSYPPPPLPSAQTKRSREATTLRIPGPTAGKEGAGGSQHQQPAGPVTRRRLVARDARDFGLREAAPLRFATLTDSERRATLPACCRCCTYNPAAPNEICPPLLAAFPTLRFSSLFPWVPRARVAQTPTLRLRVPAPIAGAPLGTRTLQTTAQTRSCPQDRRAGRPPRPQPPPREMRAEYRWRGDEAAGPPFVGKHRAAPGASPALPLGLPAPRPVLTGAQRSPEEGEGRPGRRHVPLRRPAHTRSPRAGPHGAPGARRAQRRLRSPSRSFLRSRSVRAFCAFVPEQRSGSKGRSAGPGSGLLRAAQAAARAPGRRGGRGAAAGHGPGRARLRHSAAGLGPGPGRRGRVRRGHERGEGWGEGS